MKFEDEIWGALNRLADIPEPKEGATMNLTDDQRAVLETVARIDGPALLRARGLGTFTLEVEDGATLPSVRVLELDEVGAITLSPAGDPGHPYLWAEVTEMGRAALQALQATQEPKEGTTMDLTTAQRAVLEEMLARQADHGQATTMTRTHAGVPAWWTNNGHSIRQDELTALNFHGLAGCANEPSPTKHIWRVNVEEAQAALQATQTPTDQPPAQHLPRRGDAVERWLESWREAANEHPDSATWATVVTLLEDYRTHADAGVALDADLEG